MSQEQNCLKFGVERLLAKTNDGDDEQQSNAAAFTLLWQQQLLQLNWLLLQRRAEVVMSGNFVKKAQTLFSTANNNAPVQLHCKSAASRSHNAQVSDAQSSPTSNVVVLRSAFNDRNTSANRNVKSLLNACNCATRRLLFSSFAQS